MRKEIRLASFVIAGAEVLGACNGVIVPTQTPQPESSTSIENQSLNPNAIKTPNATIILPRMTPPPLPVPSATPEATPVPSIEKVKLVSEGSAVMEIAAPPKGIFNIYNATVVAVEKNPDGTVKDFAVTIAGNKISRIGSKIFKDLYSYKGVTFWINVKNLTKLGDYNFLPGFKEIGEGPEDISKYIEIGKPVPHIRMYFNSVPKYAVLNAPNKKSYDKLNDSVGKTFPRSYKGFIFNAGDINVSP